jgi:hypothetical protein
MDFKVNANMGVKVRLTDFGISILKEQHNELNKRIKDHGGQGLGEFELRLDEEGYYSTQLWMLMSKFGHVMSMTNKIPFHLDIIIQNGEQVSGLSVDTDLFSRVMYALTKNAARSSFADFLEVWDIPHEEYHKIREYLKETYWLKTYV